MVSGLKSARERRALAAEEGRVLIARLELILEELEGSPRGPNALILRLGEMSQNCVHRVCERASRAVGNVQRGVVNSPMKAIGIAFAVGALIAYVFARNRRRRE